MPTKINASCVSARSDPAESLYTLDYYLKLAEQIVDAGAHVLAIKDMAGLLRPPAARTLVGALRSRFDLPVHLHTHDTAGGQLATLIAAIDAGVDAVDGAVASMAGTTSQPSLSALVAATDHTDRATGLSLTRWATWSRTGRRCARCTRRSNPGSPRRPGGSTTTRYPAGSCPTCASRRSRSGLADRFELIEDCYAAADRMLGRLVKVTPSSKVVGDLALHLVGAGVAPKDFEADAGRLRRAGLGDRVPARRAGGPAGRLARAVPDQGAGRPTAGEGRRRTVHRGPPGAARRPPGHAEPAAVPRAGPEYVAHLETYGHTDVLSTKDFLYGLEPDIEHTVELEPGVTLLIELEAISEADERGYRNVLATLNGQLRPVSVRDQSIASNVKAAEKADRSDPKHVAAPFAGVVTLQVGRGRHRRRPGRRWPPSRR